MNASLSIFAAARDAGTMPGLKSGDRSYTFAELAELTRARIGMLSREVAEGTPCPVVGSNTLETIVTLYALLEMRIPALLVHPQLTAPERADLLAAAGRAGRVSHRDAAAIIYTSGTAGEPRGAVLTSRRARRLRASARGKRGLEPRRLLAPLHACRPRRRAVDRHSLPCGAKLHRAGVGIRCGALPRMGRRRIASPWLRWFRRC